MEEEAPRTVLYVGLLGINQTLTEGLPKTLVSLSLQGRAQAIGAVVWGWLVPTLGEDWFTQCGQWDLVGSTWLQEWSSESTLVSGWSTFSTGIVPTEKGSQLEYQL